MTISFQDFDPAAIRACLAPGRRALLRHLTVLETVDSTNLYLLRLSSAQQHGHAVVANQQEMGRGRRGRRWHSPPGSNIYLSLGWHVGKEADALMQLPLMVAVALARVLQGFGVVGIAIKWPNDILAGGKKLAGILLEARQDGTGGMLVAIGVGVNVRMPADDPERDAIDQAWTDVGSHLPGMLTADFRDRLCGKLLDELLSSLAQFGTAGFAAFATEWEGLDFLNGQEIDISIGGHPADQKLSGTAAGISDRGGLLVKCTGPGGENTIQEFLAGDVSVRLA